MKNKNTNTAAKSAVRSTSNNASTSASKLNALNRTYRALQSAHRAWNDAILSTFATTRIASQSNSAKCAELIDKITEMRGQMAPTKFNSVTGKYFYASEGAGKERFLIRVTQMMNWDEEVVAPDRATAFAIAKERVLAKSHPSALVSTTASDLSVE